MKAIDVHSHWATEKGYLYKGAEVPAAENTYRMKIAYRTREEMAEDLRAADVKTILDYGFTMKMPLDEVRVYHDEAARMHRDYPDVILGNWCNIDPRTGREGLRELERCLKELDFVGLTTNAAGLGITCADPAFYPFYETCQEAKAPVLICVGFTGLGAGLPGGAGLLIENCHPRYIDQVAARFPDLTIIAARPAWPWQVEMIAVLLHKPNVWNEVHGWSPKYFTPDLKWEINHRLQDRVMFGADYPLFSYERLFRDWESEQYPAEILAKVFYKNAQRLFEGLGRRIGPAG
jgi:predicted TIM-barrel fold metal-dependent hydrolase